MKGVCPEYGKGMSTFIILRLKSLHRRRRYWEGPQEPQATRPTCHFHLLVPQATLSQANPKS